MKNITSFELDEFGNIKINNTDFATTTSNFGAVKNEITAEITIPKGSISANLNIGVDQNILKQDNINPLSKTISNKVSQINICYPNAIITTEGNNINVEISVLKDTNSSDLINNLEKASFSIHTQKP